MGAYGIFRTLASVSFLIGAVSAQGDPNAPIDKPALEPNLDYLTPGLIANLPQKGFSYDQWGAGWVPEECITIANNWAGVNPQDFQVFNVHYEDCGDAWVFCHHKDSPISIEQMGLQFGQLPLQMREWVRHVVDVPGAGGSAFEWDGSVTFISPTTTMIATIIHEVGHSLDLSGAYADKPISSSANFWNNYYQDTNVPDNYAKSNMIENVAQNTVVSVFNENVPGQFGSVEPNWNAIFHQYATMITEARDAGQGNSLYLQGKSGTCQQRLPPSAPTAVSGMAKVKTAGGGVKPFWKLSPNVTVLDTGRKTFEEKWSNCSLTW